jgi:hypothetical protein
MADGTIFDDVFATGLHSDVEQRLVGQMRQELQAELAASQEFDDVVGDIRLLRFIRGYDCQIPAACDAYRAMLAWRKEHGLDARHEEWAAKELNWESVDNGLEVGEMFAFTPMVGFSTRGHLVQLENMGRHDYDKLGEPGAADKLTNAWRAMLELRSIKMNALSREKGMLVKSVQIRDLGGFRLSHGRKLLPIVKAIIKEALQNHPESVDRLIFLNTVPVTILE